MMHGISKIRSIATAVAVAAFLYAGTGMAAERIPCRVVGVSDGDTIKCLTHDKRELKVRLAKIDAPESRQDFGSRAKQKLSEKVFGRNVELDVSSTDRYGRLVATVTLGKRDINHEMVEDGFAWVYRNFTNDPNYISSENRARANKRGLWLGHKPIPPWDWRRGDRPGPVNATTRGSAIYQSMRY